MRDDYLYELVQTVAEMFAKGDNLDPNAAEIAEANFPGKALGGEIIEGIRKKLPKIKAALEVHQEFDTPHLVSQTYYVGGGGRHEGADVFRNDPPTSDTHARRCLPLGHGKKAWGIRTTETPSDDLIWQAVVQLGMKAGGGRLKANIDRTLEQVAQHRLEPKIAAEMMNDAAKHAQPSRPALAEQVMGALPPADEEAEQDADRVEAS